MAKKETILSHSGSGLARALKTRGREFPKLHLHSLPFTGYVTELQSSTYSTDYGLRITFVPGNRDDPHLYHIPQSMPMIQISPK
jgi:hypothetical protein